MTGLKAQQTLLVVATAMKKFYKAGTRSSVTLAAQNADRRAVVSEIELALSTHTRRMRFSGPLTGVLCKRPFPEFVAKIRIQRQRSSADIYRSCEQNCNRPAAFKNATVRERPIVLKNSSHSTEWSALPKFDLVERPLLNATHAGDGL